MLSRKILAASQSGGGGGGGGGGNNTEAGQANGVAVSNTLLPSTVVCYTHGVSGTFNANSIDGWYRATSGNLYESSSLFSAEGSGSGAYGRATTYGHPTAYGLNSGYFTSLGYSHSNGDYSLIVYQPVLSGNGSVQDQRWQCNWVRDYLPDHLDSNTDSLCIEMFVNPVENYESYSRLVSASGWRVDAPAGFELNYSGTSDTVMEIHHNYGSGTSNRVGDTFDVFSQDAWSHVSWLWDFENSRVAFHKNGSQVYSSTDSNLPTAANWSLASSSYTNLDTLLLGYDSGEHNLGSLWCQYMEVIISVDDSTKQARYGSSFTPSTTPLIAGGS